MKNLILVALVALSLSACTNKETTIRVLEEQGYTQIEASGYAFFGCSEGDTFKTKFTAVSPAGKKVSGVVCSGFLKGATIRFN